MQKLNKKQKRARNDSIHKYNRNNSKIFSIRLMNERDKNYIEFLATVKNKSQFLRDAIDNYLKNAKIDNDSGN